MGIVKDWLSLSVPGQLSQFFPPKPGFTEKDLPDLHGKVYLITGANTGIGKALASMLYGRHATVFVAARTASKLEAAMDDIKSANPPNSSKGGRGGGGELIPLSLDLSDLASVKNCATSFLSHPKATRLDVLFNNAGVMTPGTTQPPTTVQGTEIHLGVNCVGPFLLTKFLTPLLRSTSSISSSSPGCSDNPRIIWVSSSAVEVLTPHLGVPQPCSHYLPFSPSIWNPSEYVKYGISKAGNYLQAAEFARREKEDLAATPLDRELRDEIFSLAVHPGYLASELWRGQMGWLEWLISGLFQPPMFGAYTLLYAGLSPEVKSEWSGNSWVVPWGRKFNLRSDLKGEAICPKEEGGAGTAKEFWEWCEGKVEAFS